MLAMQIMGMILFCSAVYYGHYLSEELNPPQNNGEVLRDVREFAKEQKLLIPSLLVY